MHARIKKLWLAALRSGNYPQGPYTLRTNDDDGSAVGYCCMGVLCDLYRKDNGIEFDPKDLETSGHAVIDPDDAPLGWNSVHSTGDMPTAQVATWAGLPAEEVELYGGEALNFDISEELPGHCQLSDANDEGATFAEIADALEKLLD